MRTPTFDPGDPPESEPDQPTTERIEALLQLIADEDDRAVLHRIQEALSIGGHPTDDDVEVYADLWETFGEDPTNPEDLKP